MDIFGQVITTLVQINAVIVLWTVSTAMTGFIVTIGDGWGKIRGSNLFQSYWRLLCLFVIEGLLIWYSTTILEPYVTGFMLANLIWLPAFDFEFFAIFTLWFSHAFDFDFHLWAFGLLQIPTAITFLIAYYSQGLPILPSNISWLLIVLVVLIVGLAILVLIILSKALGWGKPEL